MPLEKSASRKAIAKTRKQAVAIALSEADAAKAAKLRRQRMKNLKKANAARAAKKK